LDDPRLRLRAEARLTEAPETRVGIPAEREAIEAGRGSGQRHADDRKGEVEVGHVAQVAEVVVIRRREDDVGAGDAEERAEKGERAGGCTRYGPRCAKRA
jgi:hypothetical protein